eukprot:204684-Pyramimonas_sp.AAC.2
MQYAHRSCKISVLVCVLCHPAPARANSENGTVGSRTPFKQASSPRLPEAATVPGTGRAP